MVEFLVHLHDTQGLTAKALCILCYHVSKLGYKIEDDVIAKFSLAPGQQSGKYHRQLDRALGSNRSNPHHYSLEMVGYNKYFTSL